MSKEWLLKKGKAKKIEDPPDWNTRVHEKPRELLIEEIVNRQVVALLEDPPIRNTAEMTTLMRGRGLGQHIMAFPQTIPARFVIYKEGTTTYAFDSTTGKIPYSDSSETTVIQNALDGLTSGRSTKEKVTLKGNFTITTAIAIPSYTIMDLSEAKMSLGGDNHLFTISSTTDVEILGGICDGVKATYNSDVWSGIGGTHENRIIIKDVVLHDFKGKGIFITRLKNSVIENVISYSNDQDGIYLEGTVATESSNNVSVNNCICRNNGRKGFNNGYVEQITFSACKAYSNTEDGWNIEGGTGAALDYYFEDVKLENCYSYSNSQYGYRIQLAGRRTTLLNCDAYSNTFHGLYIRGQDTAWTLIDTQVIGGNYYENTQSGIIFAFGINHLKIIGVSVFNNDQGDTNNDGISLTDLSSMEHVILNNIHAYDNQGTATQDRGIDLSTTNLRGQDFTADTVWGEGNSSALWRGTVDTVRNVQGNSDFDMFTQRGTATVLNGNTSIAVNLSGQITNVNGSPTGVLLTPAEAPTAATYWYVDTFNSGSFTINIDQDDTDNLTFYYKAYYDA
jgi:hypothetical protein